METDNTDDKRLHDAQDVGCYGLIRGVATRTRTGERVHAKDVTREQAPFHCEECLTDAVVRKCIERVDHFAHKARLSPVVPRGETKLHQNCKEEIRDALISRYPNGKWECERPIPANAARNIPKLIPDVSGRIGEQRVVIEIQASYLTLPKIIKRALSYRAHQIPILWVVPLTEDLGTQNFRPRLYERYLHSIYYGRTYYWLPGDGISLRPIHYGVAYRYIDQSEWYGSDGDLCQAGGYDKPYKIIKKPIYGKRVNIADDFQQIDRDEFVPWNENKAIPPLLTWQDNLKEWWDNGEQSAFERQFNQGFEHRASDDVNPFDCII